MNEKKSIFSTKNQLKQLNDNKLKILLLTQNTY